ncbi:MAG: CocE/NonD family hydrolase, partial [Bradyrhizobium sp.]
DNGWQDEPRVQLAIRRPDRAPFRMEDEFPLARTQWTKFFLDGTSSSIGPKLPAKSGTVTYEAMGDGLTFRTAPFEQDTEFTGFVTARLFVSSSTSDMDVFVTLRIFDPDGREVIFVGAHEPTPVARGWLRASHRKIDPDRTLPYRVFHAHDEIQKLSPDQVYELDVELWPTCMVFPKGYTMALTLMGKDFEFPDTPGRLLHNHPMDRTKEEFGGANSILTGGEHASYLLMPLIPPRG